MIKTVKTPVEIEQFWKKHGLPSVEFSTLDIECLWDDITTLKSDSVIVEIGVKFGTSTTAFALMAPKGVEIHSIDIEDPDGRKQYWERTGLDKVSNYILGDSVDVARGWDKPIDVLHIDGDHSYKGCKRDIKAWFPFVKKGGRIYFHDCDESSVGVMRAVSEFVDTHIIKSFKLFKEIGKNTSMARIVV